TREEGGRREVHLIDKRYIPDGRKEPLRPESVEHAHLPPVADQRRPLPDRGGGRGNDPGDRSRKQPFEILEADACGERDDMLVAVHYGGNFVENAARLLRPDG